jgi:3-mercaptopyruvate sulfurtransferase SseA
VLLLYEQQIRTIKTDDLKKRLKQKDKPCLLIDARDVESYYKGHIPGACSMDDGEIMSLAKNFNKDMDIITYGPGSSTKTKISVDAAQKFMSLGFKHVCVYDAGLEEWAQSGNRVDRSESRMT